MKNEAIVYPYSIQFAPIVRFLRHQGEFDIISAVMPGYWYKNGVDASFVDEGDIIGIPIIQDFESEMSICETVIWADYAYSSPLFRSKVCKQMQMNNSSRYSFPACSDHVIGVKNSFLYNNGKFKIQWYPFDDIEIVTGGRHELLLKNNTVFHTPGSNSFSAPVITAKITDCISGEKHVQKYNVLKMLEQDASTVIGEYIFPFSPYPWNNINSSITEPVFSSILVNRVISSKKESEVPIIRMSGNNSSAESLFFGMLKAFFVNKSVSVYSLTSVFSEMDRSCIYCPEGCDYNSLIISITQKFDCQLVLVHGEIENYDIGIFIGSDVISTECDGVCRDFNGFSVNSVLEYIYDMLI